MICIPLNNDALCEKKQILGLFEKKVLNKTFGTLDDEAGIYELSNQD
jgi:hypothetical protein